MSALFMVYNNHPQQAVNRLIINELTRVYKCQGRLSFTSICVMAMTQQDCLAGKHTSGATQIIFCLSGNQQNAFKGIVTAADYTVTWWEGVTDPLHS